MKKKIIFVLSLLFGLMFIIMGLNKFFNFMPPPKDMPAKTLKTMMAFMEITWLMPLVGFAEVLGGILFILPRTRALGAIVIFPVMIGICCANATMEPSGFIFALVLLAINLWVIVENRHKYLPMLQR